MNVGLLVRLLLVSLLAGITTQLIRSRTPALAMLVSLASLLVLTGLLLPQLRQLWQTCGSLLYQSGLEIDTFMPLVKVLIITQITRISAELCRDAGERALAAKLELCGSVVSLLCVLPLAQRALELVGALG